MGGFNWFRKGLDTSLGSPGAPSEKGRPTHALSAFGAKVRCHHFELSVLAFDPHLYVGVNPPPEGTELFTALVEIVNLGDKQNHYAPHQWRLFDREHFSHEPVSSHYSRKPALSNSYLAPGAPVRGYITFQLPKGSIPSRLSFADYHGVADFALPDLGQPEPLAESPGSGSPGSGSPGSGSPGSGA